MSRFTADELAIAKSVDLVAVAEHLGFTPKKIGRFYTLKEMDSIRIYNRRNWFRWSMKDIKGHNGGSQIDFLREFAGMDVKEAVFWLLDFTGYKSNINDNVKADSKNILKPKNYDSFYYPFELPAPSQTNNRLYAYLNKKRCISISTIDYFVNHGLIYESSDYHNIVFKGNDKNGVAKQASLRGTIDVSDKKPYKRDVLGSDKNYGFNISDENSDSLILFEGAIDLMSYVDIFQEYDSNMLSLGMVCDRPLERFLEEHPNIKKLIFCLDNDTPGREATKELMSKYIERGYVVCDTPAPVQYKDINEWLVASKLSMTMVSEKRNIGLY